jgi:hypothetical protein
MKIIFKNKNKHQLIFKKYNKDKNMNKRKKNFKSCLNNIQIKKVIQKYKIKFDCLCFFNS